MNHWYVIKTKPKKEDAVASQLHQASFEVFVPKIKSFRKETIGTKPLFPSYLFIQTNFGDPSNYRLVKFTRGVSKILGDQDGPLPIETTIVKILREKTLDGSLLEQDLLFKEGSEVTVKKGILKDLRGIVERNLSDSGRVKILFKWMNGTMRAILKYTELEKAA